MEENNSKKKINAKAINALLPSSEDSAFDSSVKDLLGKSSNNIEKLTIDEIAERFNIKIETSESLILVINEIEVTGNIYLERIASPVLIINSRLENLEFSGLNNKKSTFSKLIYFHNTFISKFSIIHCFIKNDIWFDGKTYIENLIVNSSSLKNIVINTAIIDVFSFKKVIIGKSCQLFKSKIGNVAIDESELNDLAFNNTCIQRNLSITDSKANQLVFSKSVVNGLWLNTTNNIKTLALADKSKFSLIDFSNQCHVSEFFLTNVKLDKFETKQNCTFGEIKLDSSTVFNDFSCSDNVAISELLILSSFLGETGFDLTKIGKLSFENSYAGHLFLKNSEIEDFLADDATKTGDIVFEKCQIDFLKLIEHFGSLTFTGSKIKLGRIDDSSIHRFDISMGSEFEMYLKGCQVNWLSFSQTTISKNSILSISDGSVYCIEMDEFTVQGNLHFRKIGKQENCFDWWWKEFDEIIKGFIKGYFTVIQNLKVDYENSVKELKESFNEPIIRISHSTLGKTEFTNCKLGDFRFEFNNSRITECFISGGTIPSKNIVIIDDQEKELNLGDIETHSQKASIYNQFKKIFEAQGDAYRAAQFQAKWAEHQKILLEEAFKEEKKSLSLWKIIRHLKNEKAQDISIFWFNQKSNRHGENWLQAIKFILIVSIPAYILFLTLSCRFFTSEPIDWSLIGYYFEFLNPVRKASFIDDIQPHWTAVGIDFLARIFIAYGIYQFVAAFRKHGRKK